MLRGARQVGKTTAIRLFARSFRQFISLNLETDDAKMFEGERNIHRLVDRIFFEKQALKGETDTLIFIDEIQEVPTALNMLRYFYEEYPQYYVVAAGSLLESLFNQNISFPILPKMWVKHCVPCQRLLFCILLIPLRKQLCLFRLI